MKTNSLFWALTWAAAGSLAMMQGCGGDDDDDGGDGDDDKGGSSGSGTTGGSSGSGGKGGSSGSSGKGGTGGTPATGGSSGTAPGGAGGVGGDEGGAGGAGGAVESERTTVCAEYCTLYWSKVCYQAPANTYDDLNDCQTTCEDASWSLGTRGAADGNSVHCRLTHAGLATDNNPPDNVHCGHASETPTDSCVD